MRIGDDLPRDRTDEPAIEGRPPTMADDDVIDCAPLGIADDLLRRVAHGDVQARLDRFMPERRVERTQHRVAVAARVLRC